MATEQIKIPVLSGGVSKQPPHMRLSNQTETATNVVTSVFDGCSKRPGSRYVCAPTLTSGQPARMHAIHRDDSEKYLVLVQRVSTATVQVRTSAGTDCPVFVNGASQTYLDSSSADADDYRLVTIADYTMVGNANVPMAAVSSLAYAVAGSAYDFETLIAKTPTVGSYWQARNDSISNPAGYFQYLPGGKTYATCRFDKATATTALASYYTTTATSLVSFAMFFSVGGSAQTGATYTTATRTLAKTGAFTNVSPGDFVNITGGTGATAGYYQIESKIDNDTVIITASAGGSNQVNYTFDGVGKVAFCVIDMQQRAPTDMHDVAKELQSAIRESLGGLEACVEWVRDTAEGRMVVTSPFGGAEATFPAFISTTVLSTTRSAASFIATNVGFALPDGVTATTDITADGHVFASASNVNPHTITAGTGDPDSETIPVLDRWVRVPAPNQKEAILDDATMPQQLVRLNPAGTYTGGYAQFTEDLQPFAWWRLGESTGTVAADVLRANNGTYQNTPTLGATGAINGDTDTAVTFASASTEYILTPPMFGWMSKAGRGITIEAWVKSTAGTISTVFGGGKSSTKNAMRVCFSTVDGSGNSAGGIFAELIDDNGLILNGRVNSNTTIDDGNFHHLVVTFLPASNVITIYLDGTSQTVTYINQQTPAVFADLESISTASTSAWSIGAYLTSNITGTVGYLDGTLDELAIYHGVMPSTLVSVRYNQGINSAYSHAAPVFVVRPTDWEPRLSGDEVTNPIPKAIQDGRTLSDLSFFRNRLWFGANEQLFSSQDGDFFNLFADDHDNITDSDPIQKSLSTRQVTVIDFLTEVRKSLLVTTRAGRQFELGTGTNETLTPTTGALSQTTTKSTTQGTRPAVLDTFVYLPGVSGGYSDLFEYQTQESVLVSNASRVSAHVETFLPSLRSVVTCGNENFVLCLGTDSAIYAYRFFFRNDQKEMSAWTKWTFDAAYTVRDIAVIGTDLFLLVNSNSLHTIERIALARVAAESGFPFVVNIDRMFSGISGSFGGGNTTWTIPVSDPTINRVVTSAGAVHTATTSGTTVTVTGQNLAASTVLIGRSYDMSVQLSRAYKRDANAIADLGAQVDHRETIVRYADSGDFAVAQAKTGSATRTDSLVVTAGTVASGEKQVNHVGNAKDITLTITSSDVRPVNVASIEYVVETTNRSNP